MFYDATWPYKSALPAVLRWEEILENASLSSIILSYERSHLPEQMGSLNVVYIGWKMLLAM